MTEYADKIKSEAKTIASKLDENQMSTMRSAMAAAGILQDFDQATGDTPGE